MTSQSYKEPSGPQLSKALSMLDSLSTLTSTDPVDFVEWYEKLGQELQIYGFGFTPHNALILANGGIGCCPSSLGYFTESGELLMRIVPRLLANLRRNEDINNLINHAETQSNNAYELIFAIGILLKLWDITEAVNAPTMRQHRPTCGHSPRAFGYTIHSSV